MRVATVNWGISPCTNVKDFFDHLNRLLLKASGCQTIVLPELFSLELLSTTPPMAPEDEPAWLARHFDAIRDNLRQRATFLDATIVGGSHFFGQDGVIRNVCPIVRPDGSGQLQSKNKLTSYERQTWKIAPGTSLVPPSGKVSTLICYDAEFPEAGRSVAEAGAEVLAVPAFTETIRGFQRVRWSSLARAIENQTFVIHASLVGGLGREPVPETFGTSAIIAPSVAPFPHRAVLAETELNKEGVAIADLDFSMLAEARASGDVRNWNDRAADCWEIRGTSWPD